MKDQSIIGIDIGGTKFAAGLVSNGALVASVEKRIDAGASKTDLLEVLFDLIDEVWQPGVSGIGVGVPGLVDKDNLRLFDLQNIPMWKDVALGHLLQDRFGVPVRMDNDANCFAQAERHFGHGRGYDSFVGLTLGTGLGMGVVIDGRLYSGALCGAGEIGMLPYLDGIIEDYAGSFLFSNVYGSTGEQLYGLAEKGDKRAREAFAVYGTHLGKAICVVLHMFAPQAVIIGGSISQAYRYFEQSMHLALKDFAYQRQLGQVDILPAKNLEAPVLGAAALWHPL